MANEPADQSPLKNSDRLKALFITLAVLVTLLVLGSLGRAMMTPPENNEPPIGIPTVQPHPIPELPHPMPEPRPSIGLGSPGL